MEEILRLKINVIEVIEVKGFAGTGRLVMFDGTCEGKYFNGTIQHGGVDTQKENHEQKSGSLSARYIIKGTDNEGNSCGLFIENNGVFGEEFTSPKIFTDSENLKWIEKAELKGKIDTIDNQLTIMIYR